MEGMEIEGKTIDEAIEKACSAFQVPREKLNIEIISEGSPGFLGLGAKKALIRAGLLSIDMTLDTPARPGRNRKCRPVRSLRPTSRRPQPRDERGRSETASPDRRRQPSARRYPPPS